MQLELEIEPLWDGGVEGLYNATLHAATVVLLFGTAEWYVHTWENIDPLLRLTALNPRKNYTLNPTVWPRSKYNCRRHFCLLRNTLKANKTLHCNPTIYVFILFLENILLGSDSVHYLQGRWISSVDSLFYDFDLRKEFLVWLMYHRFFLFYLLHQSIIFFTIMI